MRKRPVVLLSYKHLFEGLFDTSDEESDASEEEEDSDEEENQTGQGVPMDLILTAIPQLYQYRVKAILLRIMRDPRKILGWNHRGELQYRGETIPGVV
jgi:hypothetical protein